MVITFRIIVIFFISLEIFASSGVEEQRKYQVDPKILTSDQINLVNPFVFHQHSKYVTYDIYFDSLNWMVRKANHSFRLRRVEKKKDKFEYAVQLKSEMTTLAEIRSELEYKDLSKQKVGTEMLTDLIDQFIANESSRLDIAKKLSTWMGRKQQSSLAPFQKLVDLNIESSQLVPIVWGKSIRQRYHIYTSKSGKLAQTFSIKNSEKNIFLVPDFFKKQPDYIWLMEASYDTAEFRNLLPGKVDIWPIHELEIENKYRPRKLGTLLLNDLEQKMSAFWSAKPNKESKYLQSSKYFHPENQ